MSERKLLGFDVCKSKRHQDHHMTSVIILSEDEDVREKVEDFEMRGEAHS